MGSPNLDVVQKELGKLGYFSNVCSVEKCPYIEINGDWNKYYSSLSKNFRQDIRTQYNRIKKNGFIHRFSSKEKDVDDIFLNNLIDMHLNGIAGKNKVSFLETEKGQGFFKKIVQKFEKQGWVTINVMNINDKVASYALGFRYGNKFYYWNVGKNNKYDNYSPGKLLLQHMLKESFFNINIEEFDLLRGEENYKFRWTKLERKNYQITILSDTRYSMVVFKAYDFYHSILKK